MQYRLDILDEHGLKLSQIQETIATLDPFEEHVRFSMSCARSRRS